MKTMSPPEGVQTSPTETPGVLTRSSTSLSARILRHAQRFVHHLGRDHQLLGLALGDAPRLLSDQRGDFAFEIPHAGFTRVAVNDLAQTVVGELDLLAHLESVLVRLLGNQVLVGDLDLLDFDVARELDDFHAVSQRLRNRIDHVRRGDEHHLGQIKRHVQIVIAERTILLRIEHFHQRRRRIAPEIASELVHFVQHEDWIVGFGPANSLDDLSGQRADIGPAVAADFRFIVHPAHRDAHEFAAQRTRDRFPERSFPHSWRPEEAQDRPLHAGLEFLHREIIENALFHLFQVVVVLVQDGLALRDVDFLEPRGFRPGQRNHPFQIGARDHVLGRSRSHLREPLQFAVALLARFRRACRISRASRAARRFRPGRRRIRPVPCESP